MALLILLANFISPSLKAADKFLQTTCDQEKSLKRTDWEHAENMLNDEAAQVRQG
jgi:hypothetical protein